MADYQQIAVNEVGAVTVVRFLNSKIRDEEEIQQLGAELFSLVDDDKRKLLLLNFDKVDIMSSAALGKLIRLDKKVKNAAGQLKLCCICQNIYEVFAITKLNKVFAISDDQKAALAAFK